MALRDQPYIPLYVQDFLTDEKLAYCSAEATGVYIRIMCLMHKSEEYGKILLKQKFKQSDKQIKNFASQLTIQMPYDYNTILCALEELIDSRVLSEEPCALIQKRMVKDNSISELRSSAGKKGGVKTMSKKPKISKGKSGDFALDFAQAKIKANTEYEYEYEYEDENENEETKKEKGVIGEKVTSFDLVWNLYEKKGNRKTSEKKWSNLKNHCREAALKHIPLYVKSTPDKKYRKNFETYINQEVWNDEIILDDYEQKRRNANPVDNRHDSGHIAPQTNAADARASLEHLGRLCDAILQQPVPPDDG